MYNYFFSIDQSLNNFAVVIWEYEDSIVNAVAVDRAVIRTGDSNSKGKQLKTVVYRDGPHERIRYICQELDKLLVKYSPTHIAFEELAFCSSGNATRDLAGLLFTCIDNLLQAGYASCDIHKVSPSTVKKYARESLPKELQVVSGKKRKMDKNSVTEAAEIVYEHILDGYKKTGLQSGRCDLADAIFIGEAFIDKF